MNLNIENWEEFILDKIFTFEPTKGLDSTELIEGDDITYVGAKHENNGFIKRCVLKDFVDWVSAGNCIVFIQLGEGSAGYVNYIPENFIGMGGKTICGYLIGQKMTSAIGIFLETILCLERPKYSFGRSWTGDRLKKTKIMLPIKYNTDKTPFIDETHEYSEKGYVPDWEFMENYIKSLHSKPLTTQNKNKRIPALNIDKWKEFSLNDIFTKRESGKVTQAYQLEEGQDIPYLGAKKDDNGVMSLCKKNKKLESKGNCIVLICDGQGSVGLANYMESDFLGTVNLELCYNEKHLNKYVGLFLTTIISQERPKYSFGRKWKPNLDNTKIKLPAKKMKNGKIVPDWQFMENYIKALPYGDRI